MSGAGGIPSWAVPGAKVVCIDDVWYPADPDVPDPVKGAVYTIAWVEAGPDGCWCWLREYPSDCNYELCGFRPAVEPKTEAEDLAQFRKLLTIREPEAA